MAQCCIYPSLPFLRNGGYSNKFKTLLDKLKQSFFNKDEKDWVKWKKEFVIDLTCARWQVIGDKIKKGLVLQGILKEKAKLLDRGDQSMMPSKEFEEVILVRKAFVVLMWYNIWNLRLKWQPYSYSPGQ